MTTGKAYAFFDNDVSLEDIVAYLPTLRALSEVPDAMELYLMEGTGELREKYKGDSGLMGIADEANEFDMRYVMEATLPGKNNQMTARQLGVVLNQAYLSDLWPEGAISTEKHDRIVYLRGSRYVDRH